ncbi:hypothetical protein [Xanthomonas phage SB1]|uniref:Tail fiber protein n=1 Tax=Xanthomonas phage SB1 TaxID=3117471 RepID=A0ABZ2GZ83_9CAUD
MIENRLAGFFTVTVHNADGTVKEQHEFKNLITDTGLNSMGSFTGGSNMLRNCQVGTGSTPPTNGDSALASFLALQETQWSADSGYNATDDYHWRRWTYQFTQGKAAGNLTEIGIGMTGNTQGNLWSRALITDTSGNPTTLVITANEFLTVRYELRNYPKHGDTVQTVTIDGVERTITIRPMQVKSPGENWANLMPAINAYDGGQNANYDGIDLAPGPLGAEDSIPGSPVYLPQSTRVWAAYVPNSFRRVCNSTVPINMGNGTWPCITFNTGIGKWQMGINPPLVKNNTQELKIACAVSWARYTP